MTGGYVGKILFVDLSSAKINEEKLPESILRDFLGGYGLGAKIIYDRMKKGTDPLGKDSIFGLVTGPLTGTPAPTGTRFMAVGKSPLTGTWGDANCGGRFGPALKFGGFDAVFFKGTSFDPVYLFIDNGSADLRDASFIWGEDVSDTEDSIKAKHGKECESACIGPAGEKKTLFASVMNDKGRAAARSGLGAVMGSKKVKAVVTKGDLKVPLSDQERFMKIRKESIDEIVRGVGFSNFYRKTGTPGYTPTGVVNGDSPTRNWSGVGDRDFSKGESIGYDAGIKYQVKRYGCWQCPIACGFIMTVREGPYKVGDAHRPEYETACAFGTDCLNDNMESLIKLNDICNRYGIDTISAGASIAFAIECYENGLITNEDTDGLKLAWGNHQTIVALMEKIAKQEGIGKILAQGLEKAAEKIGKGAERYAMHVRGEAVPMHDPRYEPAMGTIYTYNATPAHHTQASQFIPPPDLDLKVPPWDNFTAQRGNENKVLECLMHIVASSGLCLFGYLSTSSKHIPEYLSAATGWTLDMEDLLVVGERIANIRHCFNIREGLNPASFRMPKRIMGIPQLDDGPTRGRTVDLERLRKEYYQAMDWDLDTSKPSNEKLSSLGLGEVARDLC